MTKNLILLCSFSLLASLAQAQLSYRHHYYEADVSQFNTYRLAAFTINEKETDPSQSSQVSNIQSKLHEALAKNDFEQEAEPDLLIFLKLKIDTLGIELPKDQPKELIANFTVDIRKYPKYEKVFVGTVNGLIVTDVKSDGRLKKIYKKFFKDFK